MRKTLIVSRRKLLTYTSDDQNVLGVKKFLIQLLLQAPSYHPPHNSVNFCIFTHYCLWAVLCFVISIGGVIIVFNLTILSSEKWPMWWRLQMCYAGNVVRSEYSLLINCCSFLFIRAVWFICSNLPLLYILIGPAWSVHYGEKNVSIFPNDDRVFLFTLQFGDLGTPKQWWREVSLSSKALCYSVALHGVGGIGEESNHTEYFRSLPPSVTQMVMVMAWCYFYFLPYTGNFSQHRHTLAYSMFSTILCGWCDDFLF